jgi:hypothetical protein
MYLAKLLIVSLCFLGTSKSFAYTAKRGNVAAIIGSSFYKTAFGGARPGFETDYNNGFALIALGDVSDNGSLEFGIFTIHKTFLRAVNFQYFAQKAEMMHVTMGYRHWFSHRISGSVTFFSAYTMGTPTTIFNGVPATTFVDTSAADKTEYGFDYAVQAELIEVGKWALTTDIRYSWSLTPKEYEHADHYGALLGLRYTALEKGNEK